MKTKRFEKYMNRTIKRLTTAAYSKQALADALGCSTLTAAKLLSAPAPEGYRKRIVKVREGKRGPKSKAVQFIPAALPSAAA